MADERLTTTLVIEDQASAALKRIQTQAQTTEKALERTQEAVAAVSKPKAITEATGSAQTASGIGRVSSVQTATSQIQAALSTSTEIAAVVSSTAETITREVTQAATAIERSATKPASPGQAMSPAARAAIIGASSPTPTDAIRRMQEFSRQVEADLRGQKSAVEKIKDAFGRAAKEIDQSAKKLTGGLKKGRQKLVDLMNQGANLAGWGQVIQMIQSAIGKLFGRADTLIQQRARFAMIAENEGLTGAEKDARGDAIKRRNDQMAQAVGMNKNAFADISASFMLQGNGVFKSMEEAQVFAASLKQQFDIVGTGAQEAQNAMIQLKQALGSGRLQGDELRSVMENAPTVGRLIEQEYARVNKITDPKLYSGKIRQLAADGKITSEIVKNAILNSAEATNETWKKIPATWSKTFSRFENITERSTQKIIGLFGSVASSTGLANLLIEAARFFDNLIKFIQPLIAAFGALFVVIGSIATSVMQFSSFLMETKLAIPVLGGIAAAFVAVKVSALAAAQGISVASLAATKFNAILTVMKAHPVVAIATAVLALILLIVHLVRETEGGQRVFLHVVNAVKFGFNQVALYVTNARKVLTVFKNSIVAGALGIKLHVLKAISEIAGKIAEMIYGVAEMVNDSGFAKAFGFEINAGKVAMGFVKDLNSSIESTQNKLISMKNENLKITTSIDTESNMNKARYLLQKQLIPLQAKLNVNSRKQELEGAGSFESLLGDIQKTIQAKGTKGNPAHVKGEMTIDDEYFRIMKKVAGYEIVNRYMNMKPIINARFGDVHTNEGFEAGIAKVEQALAYAIINAQDATASGIQSRAQRDQTGLA